MLGSCHAFDIVTMAIKFTLHSPLTHKYRTLLTTPKMLMYNIVGLICDNAGNHLSCLVVGSLPLVNFIIEEVIES